VRRIIEVVQVAGWRRGSSRAAMEPAGTALAQLMRQRMSPVVMVMSTPRAEETCRKNRLGVVDLLRPFCVLDQINVPVRTASEQPYRLQDFELRIFYASDIAQPSPEAAEEYLVEVVSQASDDAAAALQGDPKNIEVVKKWLSQKHNHHGFNVTAEITCGLWHSQNMKHWTIL